MANEGGPVHDPERAAKLADALRERCIGALRESAEGFDVGPDADWPDLQHKAVAAMQSLVVLATMDERLAPHIAPLFALTHALDDLRNGAPHPLLKNHRTTVGGRHLTPNEVAVHAYGVALVEAFIETGFKEREAVRFVADQLAKAGVVGARTKRPVSPHMVRNWRTIAASGDAPDQREQADFILRLIKGAAIMKHGGWPMRRSEALEFLASTATSDHFRAMVHTAKDSE